LKAHIKNCLTRAKRIFPKNLPTGAIKCLIHLFHSVLQLDSLTNEGGKPSSSFDPIVVLKGYISEGISIDYQRFVTIIDALQEKNEFSISCPFTARQLTIVIEDLLAEVSDYEINFESLFADYFSIRDLAAEEFYSLLCEDVRLYCSKFIDKAKKPRALDPYIFKLAYSLQDLSNKWSHFSPK